MFCSGEHCSPLHWNTQYSSHHNIHIKQIIPSKRAANDRPYRFVPTTTKLRSGIICFDITNYLHELGTAARHMEIYQLPQSYARAKYVLILHKLSSRTGNGGSPYGNLPTTTMLRSGGICFGIAQTIFTNRERRLAVQLR